jgi:hypothetical protein
VAAVKVLDHEPHRWFLFEESGNLLLDANCNHSFIGYDFLIQLTPGEIQEYRQRGRDYLNWLSEEIHNSAPILKVSTSIYKGRDLSSLHREAISDAIEAWRLGGTGAAT